MPKKGTAFDKLLAEAIDSALSSLGDSAKQAIYYHLEDKFKIARRDIPRRLGDFQDGLEKIFGSGSSFLQILIMKKLYEKIDRPLEWDESKELVLAEYVAVAKKDYSKKIRQEHHPSAPKPLSA